MDFTDVFWDADIGELKAGYKRLDNGDYICLCCGEVFTDGLIFEWNKQLMEAKKACAAHVENKHGSAFACLMSMDKKYTGLTDNQKHLMALFFEGQSDKAIEKATGVSASTVRNIRFTLREKAKQAKIFLSLIESMEEKLKDKGDKLVSFHRSATTVDERYAFTETERKETLGKYFKDNRLLSFPTKQKRIIIILQSICTLFETNKIYSEKEINEVLKPVYEDYVTLRRYLIEYGFMERTADGSEYKVKL